MITSSDNERLKLVRKLRDRRWRDKLGLFAVEGEDLVEAGRAAGLEPADVLVAGEDAARVAKGPGSFHVGLYDALAALDPATLGARARVT